MSTWPASSSGQRWVWGRRIQTQGSLKIWGSPTPGLARDGQGGLLLWRGRQDGLVVIVLLLLLVEDLELEEELLLLQDLGIGGVHGGRPLVLLLVRGDVLVILELLHLWFQLLGFLAALRLLTGRLGLALLRAQEPEGAIRGQRWASQKAPSSTLPSSTLPLQDCTPPPAAASSAPASVPGRGARAAGGLCTAPLT